MRFYMSMPVAPVPERIVSVQSVPAELREVITE